MLRLLLRAGALGLCLALGALALPGAAQASRSHTVRPGQTLAAIARRYRVAVIDLRLANNLSRRTTLRPGQVLRVPERGVVYVRPGDTLARVSRRVRVPQDTLRQLNRLRRNARLRVGQRLVLPTFVPAPEPRDWGEPDEPGVVTLVRRGERERVRLVDAEGRVLRTGLDALGRLMRRHDEDAPAPPAPRLALLLAKLSDAFGGRPVSVVSGWRPVGGYTRASSRHTSGRAADIKIRGVGNRTLWEACRRIDHVGCGYYPRSAFTHVDARHRRTQWVDWSRPGQRPRYGTLSGPRRRGRRSMSWPRRRDDVPLAIEIVEPDGQVTVFEDLPAADAPDHEEDFEGEGLPEGPAEDEGSLVADAAGDPAGATDAGEAADEADAPDEARATAEGGTEAEAPAVEAEEPAAS